MCLEQWTHNQSYLVSEEWYFNATKRSVHVNAWAFVADPNQQDKQRMAYTQDYKFKFNYCDGLTPQYT